MSGKALYLGPKILHSGDCPQCLLGRFVPLGPEGFLPPGQGLEGLLIDLKGRRVREEKEREKRRRRRRVREEKEKEGEIGEGEEREGGEEGEKREGEMGHEDGEGESGERDEGEY